MSKSRIVAATGSGYAMFVINATAYALSVPLQLRWLGNSQFGVWLALLQGLAVVASATGWLASPIIREVAGARVTDARTDRGLRAIVATGSLFYALLGVALVLVALIAVVGDAQLQQPLFDPEVELALVLLAATSAVSLQVGLLCSVLSGHNRLHVTYLLLALQTVLMTGGAVGAAAVKPTVSALAGGYLGGVAVAWALAWVVVRSLAPGYLQPRFFDPGVLRRLVRVGSGYLGYSLAFISAQSDLFLVTAVLGPETTAVYGVAARLFDQLLNVVRRLPDAAGPTIAELDARGDLAQIQRLHSWFSRAAPALALLLCGVLAMLGPSIVGVWLGTDQVASPTVFVGLATATVVASWVHASFVVPFATNRIRTYAGLLWLESGLKAGFILVALRSVGVDGVPVATAAASLCVTAWAAPWLAARCMGSSLGRVLSNARGLAWVTAIAVVGWWIAAQATSPGSSSWWGAMLSSLAAVSVLGPLVVLTKAERSAATWVRHLRRGPGS